MEVEKVTLDKYFIADIISGPLKIMVLHLYRQKKVALSNFSRVGLLHFFCCKKDLKRMRCQLLLGLADYC